MKRAREQNNTETSIKQISSGRILYDCTYPGCTVRAHNQHNLDKHMISHFQKENKKKI